METQRLNSRDGERGMIAILMAIAMVALIGAGSLAVDIGSALVTKSELQNVSDASSLAGTYKLAELYKAYPGKIAANISGDLPTIRTGAQTYATLNKAGGMAISVPSADVEFGKYDPATGVITTTTTGVRVVRITSRRDGTANGVLPTRLARVLGIDTIAVKATTASALTPLGNLYAGQGDFPIGIAKSWFNSHKCNDSDNIVVFPTSTDSCAGWHVFTEEPASASKLGTIVDGLKAGSFITPPTVAGETYYNFTGGTVESKCSNLLDLFNAKKVLVDGVWVMHAHVPVYDYDCGNVNGPNKILGFVNTDVSNVSCGGAGDRHLDVQVKCGIVGNEVGEGGGAVDYGLLAEAPKMIY